jgi:hypothetical protein
MAADKTPEQRRIIKEIESGISFGARSGTIFTITKREAEPDSVLVNTIAGKPWALWGSDNNYAQRLIDENMSQETSAGALLFKVFAHWGKGLFFHEKDVDADGNEKIKMIKFSKLPQEIKTFFKVNDLNNFTQANALDFEWFNFYYTQYIPSKLGNKIVGVNHIRTKDVRLHKRDPITGEIPTAFLSGLWPIPRTDQIVEIPMFDKKDPLKESNAIAKHQLVSIDRDYYPTSYWQSNYSWLRTAKKIPVWINSNIDNAASIKYHVEIPEQYFVDLYPESNYKSLDECLAARKEAEIKVKNEIDECLTGAENASKIFYTKFAVDANGAPIPGWKINELKNDLKESAWINAYNTAAAAICTAHGVDPGLSGLRSAGALNVGSGSDTREKFNLYTQMKTPIPRQTTMEWWENVKEINGWDEDIHLGYRDIYLDTIDKTKTGVQTQNEQSPTAPADNGTV